MSERHYATLSLIFLLSALITMFAAVIKMDNLKTEAVERGFAEWQVKNTGEVTWKWKK